jgi:hypothetical protein
MKTGQRARSGADALVLSKRPGAIPVDPVF